MAALVELLLRSVAVLLDAVPAGIGFPALALAAIGVAAIAVAAIVAHAVAVALGVLPAPRPAMPSAGPDLRTRIAWADPDAAGHARPRAPGGVPAT